jgi:hypothetical protein
VDQEQTTQWRRHRQMQADTRRPLFDVYDPSLQSESPPPCQRACGHTGACECAVKQHRAVRALCERSQMHTHQAVPHAPRTSGGMRVHVRATRRARPVQAHPNKFEQTKCCSAGVGKGAHLYPRKTQAPHKIAVRGAGSDTAQIPGEGSRGGGINLAMYTPP